MAVIDVNIRGATNPFLNDEPPSLTTSDEDAQEAGRLPADELFDRINEILGYDLFEMVLMVEGYADLGIDSSPNGDIPSLLSAPRRGVHGGLRAASRL
jgi:hypothetical protein